MIVDEAVLDPCQFAARFRAIVPLTQERELDVRHAEFQRQMYRRVAESLPDMSITAAMARLAEEIAVLPRAEQLRLRLQKVAVLEGLGYANAEELVEAALTLADQLGEQAVSILCSAGGHRRGH